MPYQAARPRRPDSTLVLGSLLGAARPGRGRRPQRAMGGHECDNAVALD